MPKYRARRGAGPRPKHQGPAGGRAAPGRAVPRKGAAAFIGERGPGRRAAPSAPAGARRGRRASAQCTLSRKAKGAARRPHDECGAKRAQAPPKRVQRGRRPGSDPPPPPVQLHISPRPPRPRAARRGRRAMRRPRLTATRRRATRRPCRARRAARRRGAPPATGGSNPPPTPRAPPSSLLPDHQSYTRSRKRSRRL